MILRYKNTKVMRISFCNQFVDIDNVFIDDKWKHIIVTREKLGK